MNRPRSHRRAALLAQTAILVALLSLGALILTGLVTALAQTPTPITTRATPVMANTNGAVASPTNFIQANNLLTNGQPTGFATNAGYSTNSGFATNASTATNAIGTGGIPFGSAATNAASAFAPSIGSTNYDAAGAAAAAQTASTNYTATVTLPAGHISGLAATATNSAAATYAATAGSTATFTGTNTISNGGTSATIYSLAAANLGLPAMSGPLRPYTVVNFGDSITEGAYGGPSGAYQSISASLQCGAFGAAGALVYDLGFRQETTSLIASQYSGTNPFTGTLVATGTSSGTVTLTVASGTYTLTQGFGVAALNLSVNSYILTTSTATLTPGVTATLTLNQPPTATGTVTASVAQPPNDVYYGEQYPGGAANYWNQFFWTAHMLSPAVTGIPGTIINEPGANDNYVGSTATLTAVTTLGSNVVTFSSGYTGLAFGNVILGTPFSATTPPYIFSGAGTSTVALLMPGGGPANATASGTYTLTAFQPVTPFASWTYSYNSLVLAELLDGWTVVNNTLIPRYNYVSTGGGTQAVQNTLYAVANAWITANSAGANYVCPVANAFTALTSATSSLFYNTDGLHLTPLGTTQEANFITEWLQLSNPTLYATGGAYSPFGSGLIPDAWDSGNIVNGLGPVNISPVLSNSFALPSCTITNGSATVTLSSPSPYAQTGYYFRAAGNGGEAFRAGTTITTVTSGTLLTLSNVASQSVSVPPTQAYTSAPNLYSSTSSSPIENPNSVVLRGDLFLGPENNNTIPSCGNIFFTDQYGSPRGGLNWQNTYGATLSSLQSDSSGDLIFTTPNSNFEIFGSSSLVQFLGSTTFYSNNQFFTPNLTLSFDNGAGLYLSTITHSGSTATAWTFGEQDATATVTLISSAEGSGVTTLPHPAFGTGTYTSSFAVKGGINLYTGTSAATATYTPSTGLVSFIKNQGTGTLTISSASGSQLWPSTATAAIATETLTPGQSTSLWSDGTYGNQ